MVFMFYLYYVLNVKHFGQHLLFLPWLSLTVSCGIFTIAEMSRLDLHFRILYTLSELCLHRACMSY